MRRVFQSFALGIFVMFATSFSCGQNGPTVPQANLSWTQSVTPGITANCVYRCTGASCVPGPPAIFCSTAPITSYVDTTVAASATYNYAITAQVGKAESGYSNVEPAIIPANPSAPVQNSPTVAKNEPSDKPGNLEAKVIWRKN